MNISFLIGPLVGALIGGITNGIAIKMLFRPIHPIKIGNWTLPFTPGVIPKEKKRIAVKIGEVVSKELLNEEVLKTWLLKDEVLEEVKKSIAAYLKKNKEDENTVHDKIAKYIGEERTVFLICEAEETVTTVIYEKIMKMELGTIITDKLKAAVKAGSLSGLLGPMSFLLNDSFIDNLGTKLEPFITHFIEDEGEGIIRKAVEDERKHILQTPVREYADKLTPYEDVIMRTMLQLYEMVVTKHLGGILNKLNIAKIIEERIIDFDMLTLEKIILSIMQKELQAIVWFGVLLGAVMGIITNLI